MKIVKSAEGKNKIRISKKEWQGIGKLAGWVDDSIDPNYKHKISNCCGSKDCPCGDMMGDFYSDISICPKCKKYCEFVDEKPQATMPIANNKNQVVKESKKKSPKEHGFMDQCMKENKDKGDSGAYCASIVDKVKGTTKWRKGPKEKKVEKSEERLITKG